ncbi:MAG: rhamnulokinase [Microbacteriaceae bacterium]|nr:rhamnulokinase [Microbacteriaceae bacterium]
MSGTVAAIDLGATSGRVVLGHVAHNELAVRPIARFANQPVHTIDGLHWDVLGLYRGALEGLTAAVREEPGLASIGIDSWAVDYALLRNGRMLGEPYHYRDGRTAAGVAAVHAVVPAEELYRLNGLQHLPFNTLFQLAADQRAGALDPADTMLLVPDLLAYWLTGEQVAERTNASTTGLLSLGGGSWNDDLIGRLGLPRSLFRDLAEPGSTLGSLLPEVAEALGSSRAIAVTAVGSHDTASAIVAVPAADENFAYISCGTWGLVGVELERAVVSEDSRLANFTNEDGVDGRVRYLHNVMGLWLLSESVRTWERGGEAIDLPALLAQAAAVSTPVPVFDANDPGFLAPGDMPRRIADHCRGRGLAIPGTRAELVRSIIVSLATAFASAVEQAGELSGTTVSVIHLVGGGAQNELLCQLTADLSGRPVVAGPVEATAIGNVLVQARAQGFVNGSLEALRALVRLAFSPTVYLPRTATGSSLPS